MTISKKSKTLHSIIGLAMISLLIMGIYMAETKTYALYGIHKSLGTLVLAFALYRFYVRMKEGWPAPLQSDTAAFQLLAAKVIHWGLLLSTLMYPLSGVVMSVAEGRGLYVFGIELIAQNIDPVTNDRVALSEALTSLGESIHGSLYWFVFVFLALHIAGALKHHLVDKDETLARMFRFTSRQ